MTSAKAKDLGTKATMLTRALAYVAEGWALAPVWPVDATGRCRCLKGAACASPGKHPIPRFAPHAFKSASAMPTVIRQWWTSMPTANIGGAPSQSHRVILDIDPRNGGAETLAALIAAHEPLPVTRVHRTGGGGQHFVFLIDRPVASRTLGPGVELKSEFVVLPPSTHASGGRYEIEDPHDAVPIPAWLLTLPPAGGAGGTGPSARFDTAAALDGVGEGTRQETLFKLAAKLRSADVPQDEALVLVCKAATNCTPPFPEHDAKDITTRVYRRYPPGPNGEAIPNGNEKVPSASSPRRRPLADISDLTGPPLVGGFAATDLGNAERFVRLFGPQVRHVTTWGWLVWTGTHWQRDDTDEVQFLARETVRDMYRTAAQLQDTTERVALSTWAQKSEERRRIDAMLSLAQADRAIASRAADFDRDPYLLNVQNGTLDLRNGTLWSHNPEHLITRLAPVDYDPNAYCPRWMTFLREVMASDDGRVAYLQRVAGYALLGVVRDHVLFIFYGTGSNGKSTYVETLQTVLGGYALAVAPETFMVKRYGGIPNDLAQLAGARLVVSVELEEGRRIAEALVKQLTGGDTISARFLHREFFRFRAAFKLCLVTNHKPVIRGTDVAIWRRIRLVPFTVTIPEQQRDLDLADKLRAELPGILAWMVRGCLTYQQHGRLYSPEAVEQATSEYRQEMDVLARFLADCCEVDPAYSEASGALYVAYKAWCERSGEQAISQTAFGRSLNERGYLEDRKHVGRRRLGLRFYREGPA